MPDLITEIRKQETATSEKRGAALEKLREVLRKGDKATKPDVDAARAAAADLNLTADKLELIQALIAEAARLRAVAAEGPALEARAQELARMRSDANREILRLRAEVEKINDELGAVTSRLSFGVAEAPGELLGIAAVLPGVIDVAGIEGTAPVTSPKCFTQDTPIRRLYRKAFSYPEDGLVPECPNLLEVS